jgi:hypothetical protein
MNPWYAKNQTWAVSPTVIVTTLTSDPGRLQYCSRLRESGASVGLSSYRYTPIQ